MQPLPFNCHLFPGLYVMANLGMHSETVPLSLRYLWSCDILQECQLRNAVNNYGMTHNARTHT